MVERKLKGVLVVLSILIVIMFSGVVSAAYSCGALTSGKKCNFITSYQQSIPSAAICESWCEGRSEVGANCCYWDSSINRCSLGESINNFALGTDYASSCSLPLIECTYISASVTPCCTTTGTFRPSTTVCYTDTNNDFFDCVSGRYIQLIAPSKNCTGTAPTCTGTLWIKRSSIDDCGISPVPSCIDTKYYPYVNVSPDNTHPDCEVPYVYHAYYQCSDNDVYWYDSNNLRNDKREECSNSDPCTSDGCTGTSCYHNPITSTYLGCYDHDIWNLKTCDDSPVSRIVGGDCNWPNFNCFFDGSDFICKQTYTCGDSIIVPSAGEECDTNNLDGENCQSLGLGFDGGTLACYPPSHATECKFNTGACTDCGNNNQEGSETCDGTDLNGQTCATQEFNLGTLTCNPNCLSFNTASCCNNECTTLNARTCTSATQYRTCVTNYDSDPCRELNSATSCPGATPYCTGAGNCVACTTNLNCGNPSTEYRCSGTSCGSNVERRTITPTCSSETCGISTGSWSTYNDCGSDELCIGGTSTTTSSSARYCQACSSSQSCISGSCSTCAINSVSWNPSSGLEDGDGVTINVGTNPACNGKIVDLAIRRDQLVDTTLTTLSSVTINSGSASRGWTIDISNEDDYYARATLAVDSGIRRDSSNVYISFPPPPVTCPDTSCNNGETCNTCPQDCGSCCGDGTCNYGETCSTCSQDCGACCTDFSAATWSGASTVNSGTVVTLRLTAGSECNGKAVNLQIREDDVFDDIVTTKAVTLSGGVATATWTAVAPDIGGETNPTYFFRATSSGVTTMDSTMLNVNPIITCGNSVLDGGEACDDGDTSSGDGCSSSCNIESGWECSGEPSTCWRSCGDGTLDTGEACDDGDTSSGDGCSSSCTVEGGYNCVGEPSVCTIIPPGENCGNGNLDAGETCDNGNAVGGDGCSAICLIESGWECDNTPMPSSCWPSCGDGNLDAGEECDDNNIQPSDGCSAVCTVEPGYVCVGEPSVCTPPIECSISSLFWTEITAQEGDSVGLNIGTANCNDGETISIIIRESDTLSSDDDVITNPANVQVTANSASAFWTAEYQDDTGLGENNPPEYYFEARVISTDHAAQSALLTVTPMDICAGLMGCDAYGTQGECEADACTLAEVELAPNCGFEYDPVSRCYFANDCSCNWNETVGVCEPLWDDGLDCGGCGNGILDFGTEQCDDGNRDNNDGCSSDCEFEIIPNPPCPEGTTLCSDNSCSLNCWYTDEGSSPCNYDLTCDIGTEGCTCSDCDGIDDSCEAGLLCSLVDTACCDSVSDGVCHPYCGFIDPDCAGNDICGNGFRGFGEECDDGNTVSGDGCSAACIYEIFPGPPCPEGTMLCNDGTCSLNCDATDEGTDTSCQDGSCCEAGLDYFLIDNACCNGVTDGYCHPYCALSDPDCNPGQFGGIEGIGSCLYTKNGDDDCSDGKLTRDYNAIWDWDPTNEFYEDPLSEDYVLDAFAPGVWHYDPMDLTGLRRSQRCTSISDELICPAQIQLPAFGKTQLILSIIVLAIVYTIIVFRRRD